MSDQISEIDFPDSGDPFEGNPGIGWALGKIYRDHLKLAVPDYLKPLVEASEKKEAAKAVPSQGQKEQYERR